MLPKKRLISPIREGYFNGAGGTPLQDRFAESVILTAMEWGPRAVSNGNELEARSQVQWASVVALNGWVQVGTMAPFPVHMIEHVLSAHHDVAHGAGLAVLLPAWMRFAARTQPSKYVQFAERVFKLQPGGLAEMETASAGIDKLEKFFASIGCPTRLSQLGIGTGLFERYAQDTVRITHDDQECLPGHPPLSPAQIIQVFQSVA